MYIFFSIFITMLLIFFVINHHRKKCIIKKICAMTSCEKCCVLNTAIEPMGFAYLPKQDIFTSTKNAWQRQLGYHSLYNRGAAHFNMVFDYQPIYFNYSGRTWMIQLWKGQYGINTGAEIGVYYTDAIIPEYQRELTLFQAVSDEDMLDMSIKLTRCSSHAFSTTDCHWWLTGFCMGTFSEPSMLHLTASVTFPDCSMMDAFITALLAQGYTRCDFTTCNLTITFNMRPVPKYDNWLQRLAAFFSQWENRLFCRIFLFATRSFSLSLDRLLYLYYFLPCTFRKTMHVRRYRRKYIRRCGIRR